MESLAHPLLRSLIMRAAAVLLAFILLSPAGVGASERGWQGWAFEARANGRSGWFFGTWTSNGCEELRMKAVAEEPNIRVASCAPVTLSDEPGGVAVWVAITSDHHFVAMPTPDLCADDRTPDLEIRPVALDSPFCRRLWLKAPA